jgi:hypothetical protein
MPVPVPAQAFCHIRDRITKNIDTAHIGWYNITKIVRGKMPRILLLTIVSVFLFSCLGICDVTRMMDKGTHLCGMDCPGLCCSVFIARNSELIVPSLETFPLYVPAETIPHNLFVYRVEYPPKASSGP